jgi:uncharacterized membrane protein YkoI
MYAHARMSQFVGEVVVKPTGFALAATLVAACSNDGGSASGVAAPDGAVSAAQVAPGAGVQEDRPGLLAQATISDAKARLVVLQRVPGGRILEGELEEEGGRLLYSYEVRVANGRGVVEVEIDARTGAVVSEERDGDDEEEGPSARENDDPGR